MFSWWKYCWHLQGEGHIDVGADLVGVSMTLSCQHSILWTFCWILAKFSWIYNWDTTKNWLDFGDLDLISKVTAVEKLKIRSWGTAVFSENTVISFFCCLTSVCSPAQSTLSKKRSALKEKDLLPRGANPFLLEKILFQKGGKHFWQSCLPWKCIQSPYIFAWSEFRAPFTHSLIPNSEFYKKFVTTLLSDFPSFRHAYFFFLSNDTSCAMDPS